MKLAFVHIPKAAGGSIKKWLRKNVSPGNYVDIGHHTLEQYGLSDFDKSFCVVRNTYDRLISLYTFGEIKFPKAIRKAKKSNDQVQLNRIYDLQNAYQQGIVSFLKKYKELQWTPQSQLDYIKNVNYVLRFENLKEDFQIIQRELNCYEPLEKNVHVQRSYKSSDYFTLDFIDYVNENFKEEINHFNFQPNY